jgi:predicted RNase H-like HicB family nuclease
MPDPIDRDQYARIMFKDSDGTWVAFVVEMPGLCAQGDTATQVLTNLDCAMKGWIIAAEGCGQKIPSPMISREPNLIRQLLKIARNSFEIA